MTPSANPRPLPQAAGVDVGGTFTDVVVLQGARPPRAVKVPSTPDDQSEGVAAGLRAGGWAEGVAAAPRSGGSSRGLVAHGTTTATNAILERAVARTVLVTTAGFADVLVIARQDRPSLYDLRETRPEPLVPSSQVVTVGERTGPDGRVLVPLPDREVERVVAAVAALRPEAIAVSLLFSYANPEHERRLCEALAERLGVPVTRSSRLLPEFREYERASTCALNAAVAPVMHRYLSRLQERLGDATVRVMTSEGGTAGLAHAAEMPVHTLLSGPAAGVVAAGVIAAGAGFPAALAFDMGGTSTDVCLIRDGRPEVADSSEIAGLPFRTPAVGIHTVGAGGGSIAWIDPGGALRVGPRSAGARPGPACYGLGGTRPTVTDAHCVLGHLAPDRPLGDGSVLLDEAAAGRALATLDERPSTSTPALWSAAEGILTVVRATMARALRRVSTERGVDPGRLALIAYGGAGPLHATSLGRELGCAAVVIPPAPGVLSALGLLLAPPRYSASRTVLGSDPRGRDQVWAQLADEASTELRRQHAGDDGPTHVTSSRFADCRYHGQSHELRVPLPAGAEPDAGLHEAHRLAYGYAMPDEEVEVVTLRVVAEGEAALAQPPPAWEREVARPGRRRSLGFGGDNVVAPVLDRAALGPGDVVEGPALIEQSDATALLRPGDRGRVDDAGNIVVTW